MIEVVAALVVGVVGLVSILTLSSTASGGTWQKPVAAIALVFVVVALLFRPPSPVREDDSCGSGYMRHDC
jgi:hypothetical protein